MSEEKTLTLSLVAPLLAQLLQDTQDKVGDPALVRDIKRSISQDLKKRYASPVEKNTLYTSSALDPRFKTLPFQERQETYARVVTEAITLQEEMRQQTMSEPEAQEHQEEPGYTEEDPVPPVIPAKMRKCPLWWGGVSSSALRAPGGALVLLLSVTLLSGFSPLCIARGGGCCSMDPRFRRRLLSLISCFAGGVFLATCLLEQLPDYLQSIEEAFSSAGVTLQFPLPEFIMAMGFFLVLVLEQVILAFKDQPQMNECHALLPNSSVNSHRHGASEESGGSLFHVDLSAQSALRSFVLVFSLSLHSVLEGLAVGLQEIYVARQVLTLGLMVHKSIISFSLACTLSRGRLQLPLVAGCLLLFAAMLPLGLGLGSALSETKAPRQHRLARFTLQGLAAGSFLYITFMEILPHELGSGGNRIPRVASLLAGFALVTAVLFIKL
ncbi:zinc transporter ZIP1-like [Trematomus bernacchii]|uniref:zinc transporter ZIP1-like n=1 Tax=Trematomus bernacchii TaxID=40690 RepID=UPI00146AF959|nr:zinc transporter ZIP1-like [Trematomus bernacchii]